MSVDFPKPMLNSDDSEMRALSAGWSREHARKLALEAGFNEAGLVALPHANEERDAARYEEWVRAGRAGTMRYLERTELAQENETARLLRSRAGIPFPWARSVLVCLANYNSRQPHSIEPAAEGAGWIARYAWSGKVDANGVRRPSDYHKVLLKRMKALEARLHESIGSFEARCFVDTGPVVERALAVAAGVGWTGKNTCLIHPKLGSYGFLAVLVTSLEADKDKAPIVLQPDRCGSCRRCLEACPTGALIAPYQMDAAKCISYLTIEHRGPVAPELMEGMGLQVFGCDICQDVCPWNRKAPISADPELGAREELVNPALEWLAAMDEAEFEGKFNGSPVRRARFMGLKRNVAIAIGNGGLRRLTPWLEKWSKAADEGLRSAALWALEKLRGA
ncbi:MAG: tRNA epoxyqueuosine(34) reductase QueG [Terracidiphilus sp.]